MMSKIAVNHSALQTTTTTTTTKIFPLKRFILVWTASLERFTLIISSSPAVLFLATMSPLSLYKMKQLFAGSKALQKVTTKVEEMLETEFKTSGQSVPELFKFPIQNEVFSL